MHLGLDFDNTIANYDKIFHTVATEKELITNDVPMTKVAVRDFLRKINKEELWTEMQGYVYGLRMSEAEPFPDLVDSLTQISDKGYKISIVSHKTRYPYAGERYDLHLPAIEWIEKVLGKRGKNLIDPKNVHFEETKEDKIRRIKEIGCDSYVDDLTEILLDSSFPKSIKRILFDPNNHYFSHPELLILRNWANLKNILRSKC